MPAVGPGRLLCRQPMGRGDGTSAPGDRPPVTPEWA
jgi:hypothetical protein